MNLNENSSFPWNIGTAWSFPIALLMPQQVIFHYGRSKSQHAAPQCHLHSGQLNFDTLYVLKFALKEKKKEILGLER